jgi:hypothetical protein
MLGPTYRLLEMAERHRAQMTFFIDVSFLRALERESSTNDDLANSLGQIKKQLAELQGAGHRCELHLHPHWEDSHYAGGRWVLDVRRYRLQTFDSDNIRQQVSAAASWLQTATGRAPQLFRAGGLCIQPFQDIGPALQQAGIVADSSVYPGGQTPAALAEWYDFSKVNIHDPYRFQNDPCQPQAGGSFWELPIATQTLSPWFFWKLYLLGRLFPAQHKALGKGRALGAAVNRKKQLTQGGLWPLSTDGYYASTLQRYCRQAAASGQQQVVTLGHPKAQTLFSLAQLEKLMREPYTFAVLETPAER